MVGRVVASVFALLVVAALLMAGLVSEAGENTWIGGTVLDPAGRPLPGAEVILRTAQGRCRRNAGEHVNGHDVTGADGRFVLPAPPGTMDVYVRHESYAPAWTEARDDVVLRLEDAAWIEGSVSSPAMITASRGPWHFFEKHVEGPFRCGPLPADMVLSLHAASTTHRPYDERIVLQRGETRAMDIALDRGAEVSGTVYPLQAGARVLAHGRDGTEHAASTAEDGTFTVTGLDPGWVRLVILRPGGAAQVLDTRTGEDVEVRWPQ